MIAPNSNEAETIKLRAKPRLNKDQSDWLASRLSYEEKLELDRLWHIAKYDVLKRGWAFGVGAWMGLDLLLIRPLTMLKKVERGATTLRLLNVAGGGVITLIAGSRRSSLYDLYQDRMRTLYEKYKCTESS